MRVIIVANSLFSGGAEKQLLWIARTLLEGGVPCAIFELRSNRGNQRLETLIDSASKAGVEIIRAAPRENYLRTWLRLEHFVTSHSTAMVWTWGFRSDLAICALHLLGKRRRWICSLRTANPGSLRSMSWLVRACAAQGASYAANTWAAREMLGVVCLRTLARSQVIYNFVPESKAEPVALPRVLPRPLRVVMLGNIDLAKKGYDLVLELSEILQKEELLVEIHVAGRPDSDGKFVREIERRRLTTTLIYHGETGAPQEFLRSGHCYLLTSPFEGMPNALLEATSLALPTITTKVGDLERLATDGVQMRLVDTGDVQGLKDSLMAVMADWPAAVEMGKRGRAWCRESFHVEEIKTKLFEVMRMAANPEK
jgi:glycosyltransferase involved in cell wall biosynthesis